MASQTHQKIAEHYRALADLFDDLSVEVTARKDYPSHGYQSAARELGIGVQRYSSVRLTENERRLVSAHCTDKQADSKARREAAEEPESPEADQSLLHWLGIT